MKKILILLVLSTLSYSQSVTTSINVTTDYMVVQKGRFFGGIEFDAKFNNHIYTRPQVHYADLLETNYLETSAGIGMHFELTKLENFNIYSGVKLGFIHRHATFPLFGVEAGAEIPIYKRLVIGLRASYDVREDMDSTDNWRYNSQGYIKYQIN